MQRHMFIALGTDERIALESLALAQRRKRGDQAAILLREKLIELGLLKTPSNALNLAEDAIDGAESNPKEFSQ
jgi:hypothetical protein